MRLVSLNPSLTSLTLASISASLTEMFSAWAKALRARLRWSRSVASPREASARFFTVSGVNSFLTSIPC